PRIERASPQSRAWLPGIPRTSSCAPMKHSTTTASPSCSPRSATTPRHWKCTRTRSPFTSSLPQRKRITRAAGALSALGRREEAITLLRRALTKMEQLAASDLRNAQWQRNLVNAYEQLAQLLTETPQPEAALEAHERALTSRAQLVAITPGNLQWQYDLGAAYLKVG